MRKMLAVLSFLLLAFFSFFAFAAPGSSTESEKRGQALYAKNCAACHGDRADGKGPAAIALNPRPTNLLKHSKAHPYDELTREIAEGKPSRSMPAWKNMLSKKEIADIAAYIKKLAGK